MSCLNMWYFGLTRSTFLGLSLLLVSVRCQFKTCGTQFTDVESSAYLADVIIEARVSSSHIPLVDNKVNLTLHLGNIFKGDSLLSEVSKKNKEIVLGVFGRKENEAQCVAKLDFPRRKKRYIFFIKSGGAVTDNVYSISAFPVRRSNSVVKAIRNIVKRGSAKAPKIKKLKDVTVVVGKRVNLRCDVSRKLKPPAKIRWLFNSKPLTKRRGIKIVEYRPKKRGSRVRIRRAKVTHQGDYTCIVENAVREVRKTVVVKVVAGREKPKVVVPETDYAVAKGSKVVLYCNVSGKTKDTDVRWFHNTELIVLNDSRYAGGTSAMPPLEILAANDTDSGMYICQAENIAGKTDSEPITVSVQRPMKAECGKRYDGYCFNGGTCLYMIDLGIPYCMCTDEFTGKRCDLGDIYRMLDAYKSEMKLEKDRTLIIIGIVIAILVIIAICISSYFLAKKRREQFYKKREERKRLATDIPKELLNELEGKARAPFVPRKPTKTLGIQTLESCLTTNGEIHQNGERVQDIPNSRPKLRERLHAVSQDKGQNGGPARRKPRELKKRRSCPEPARLAGNSPLDLGDFLPSSRGVPKNNSKLLARANTCPADDTNNTSPSESAGKRSDEPQVANSSTDPAALAVNASPSISEKPPRQRDCDDVDSSFTYAPDHAQSDNPRKYALPKFPSIRSDSDDDSKGEPLPVNLHISEEDLVGEQLAANSTGDSDMQDAPHPVRKFLDSENNNKLSSNFNDRDYDSSSYDNDSDSDSSSSSSSSYYNRFAPNPNVSTKGAVNSASLPLAEHSDEGITWDEQGMPNMGKYPYSPYDNLADEDNQFGSPQHLIEPLINENQEASFDKLSDVIENQDAIQI